MKGLLALLLLVLSGCAVKTWQVEGPSKVSDGLSVSVDTRAWKYSPSDLERYVLPVYIEVENLKGEVQTIRREDVFLMDEKGNQYNPLQPADVISMFRRSYGVGFSISVGYWSYPFGVWWSPYYAYPPSGGPYPDIVNRAFPFGEVQPGAKLRGFVYFPRIQDDARQLILHVKGYTFRLALKKN